MRLGVGALGLAQIPRLYPGPTHWANEFRTHGGLVLVGALPTPSVGGAIDGTNAKAVVGRVAAGIAADDDAVAWLDRVLLNSLTAQLAGRAPFGCPRNGFVLLAGNFQKNRRMRVAEEELHDRAFDGDGFGRVGSRKGMVRMGVTRT